jgi:hypothetical protein
MRIADDHRLGRTPLTELRVLTYSTCPPFTTAYLHTTHALTKVAHVSKDISL